MFNIMETIKSKRGRPKKAQEEVIDTRIIKPLEVTVTTKCMSDHKWIDRVSSGVDFASDDLSEITLSGKDFNYCPICGIELKSNKKKDE